MITPQIERPRKRRMRTGQVLILLTFVFGLIIGAGIIQQMTNQQITGYEVQINDMTNDLDNAMSTIQDQDRQIKELQQNIKLLQDENKKMQEKVNRVLTISDTRQLAGVIQAESNTSLQGQMAVAQTILDRSMLWHMTSGEVVSNGYTHPYKGKISDRTMLAIKLVYDDGIMVFSEPTTHFYAYNQCDPSWADYKIERGKIDGHRFMY